MARALEYPAIFKALLNGGHIRRIRPLCRKAEYDLWQPERNSFSTKYVGHITQNQFEQLSSHDIIEWDGWPSGRDKHGTVTSLYYLRQEKDGGTE